MPCRTCRSGGNQPHALSSSFHLSSFAMRWTERLGDLQDTHALRKLLSHLAFGRAVYLRPTELHALGDGALETCFDSLANHGPLKFSKGASNLENELAHRGRRVDGLLV